MERQAELHKLAREVEQIAHGLRYPEASKETVELADRMMKLAKDAYQLDAAYESWKDGGC